MKASKKHLRPEDVPKYDNIELFPSLVWHINLGDCLTKPELKVLTDSLKEKNVKPNLLGNTTSKNNYILDQDKLKDFKEHLTAHCINFFDYTEHPPDAKGLYITQSWTNLNVKHDQHGQHSHANSMISGVYYFQACEDDCIMFHHPWRRSLQLLVYTEHFDKYNAMSWRVPVKTNDLILFPSWLQHSVPKKEHSGARMSLAFNTFYKFPLGSADTLTELKDVEWKDLEWSRN